MESETAKRLVERVRQLREQRGLTQEEFAEEAGLKYKHYQAVETGKKIDFRISTLEKLAKGCGLEPWKLLLPEELMPIVEEAQAKYESGGTKRTRRKRNA